MWVLRSENKEIDDKGNKRKRKKEKRKKGKAVRLLFVFDWIDVMRWFFYSGEKPTFIFALSRLFSE